MSSGGQTPPEKDYFEPGIPDELIRPSSHHSEQDSGNFSLSAPPFRHIAHCRKVIRFKCGQSNAQIYTVADPINKILQ